jgi:hypothetical protein
MAGVDAPANDEVDLPAPLTHGVQVNTVGYLREMGFDNLNEKRQMQPRLTIERKQMGEPFRSLEDRDIRTTMVDITAKMIA